MPTLALLFTKSNILFAAIRIGYNILCYHGDGGFVKRVYDIVKNVYDIIKMLN